MRRLVPFILMILCTNALVWAQDLKLNTGHTSYVSSIKFSDNGKLLVSGSWDKTLKVWDAKTGKVLLNINAHNESIHAIAITKDGKFIISGSSDRTICIWETQTGSLIRKLTGHKGGVASITLSPDEKYILSGDDKNGDGAYIWDFQKGSLINKIPAATNTAKLVVYSPDERYIALGGLTGGKAMVLLDATSFDVVRSFDAFQVSGISFSPDSKKIMTTGWDKKMILWDVQSGAQLSSISFNDPLTDRRSFALRTDWKYIFSGTSSGKILQEEIGSNKLVRVFQTNPVTSDVMYSLAISSDNKYLVAGGASGVITIWDISSGKQLKRVERKLNAIGGVSFSPDGMAFLSFKHIANGTNKLWRTDLGKSVNLDWHNSHINSAEFTPDGKFVLTTSDNEIVFSDVATQNVLNRWKYQRGTLKYGNIIPNQDLFVARWEPNRMRDKKASDSIALYNLITNKLLNTFAIAPQQKGLPKIVDPSSGTEHDMFRNVMLTDNKKMRFSPDEKNYLIWGKGHASCTYCENAIEVIDSNTHELRFKLKGHKDYITSVHYSNDGKLIVSGSSDGTIKVWDSSSGALLKDLVGHTADISGVQYDSSNKLISSSYDGTVKLWDMNSFQEIATFVGLKNSNESLVFTPDGYYFGNKRAVSDIVHFTKDGKVFLFDQFDLQNNRPDVVLQRIGTASPERIQAYKKAYEKRLKILGFDPSNFERDRSFNVPEIHLTSSTQPFLEVTSARHTIAFSANDALFNLERLFVDVNGVPLYGVKGKSLSANPSKSAQFSENITLSSGKNVIKVSVLNEKGVESLAERIEVTYTPAAQPIKPNLHVIAIGVSKFVDAEYNLTYADKDANDLSSLMKTASSMYGNITVHTLTNEQATRANVLKLRSELEKTTVDDEVVVFLASHGVLDEELDYYLAMHDMDFDLPKKGGLRYDELEGLLDAIPARNKLLLIDACHSGEVDKEESQLIASNETAQAGVSSRAFKKKVSKKEGIGLANSFELMKELFADLRRNNGAVVISSASGKEYAFESSEWSNGVFTYALLEGLKTGRADLNKDKAVQVSELRDYVSKRVQDLTMGKQNPTSRTENLENDFRVW